MRNKSSDVEERITAARVQLIMEQPFFGTLVSKLKFTPTTSISCMGVDPMGNVGYNEEFVKSLSIKQLKFVLAHEVMHCACKHLIRRGSRSPYKWNIAIDIAVDNALIMSGIGNPPQPNHHNSKYYGMSAEDIYEKLKLDDADMPEEGFDIHKELTVSDAGSFPDQSEIEASWNGEVIKAAMFAKKRGSFPDELEVFFKELLRVKTDWVNILWQFMNSTARNDYRLYPPNKKHLWRGFILPGIRSEAMEVAVAVDTSLSIDNELLRKFISNVQAILDMNIHITMHYYECDAKVHKYREYHNGDNIDMKVKGRGGTSFVPVFNDINERSLPISCLVYLTDLDGAFPERGPEYPVLWLCPSHRYKAPPFGEVVVMED